MESVYYKYKRKADCEIEKQPKDFTFDEMESLLLSLGFEISNKGKTSGSRVLFMLGDLTIDIHKPHPQISRERGIDMSDYLEYKGYLGTVGYSSFDNLLYGEVAGIKGLILFHGDNLTDLKIDFEAAVDHYLSCCDEEGISPQIPCYGDLNIKISPNIHKQLQVFALNNNKTQNETIEEALIKYISA